MPAGGSRRVISVVNATCGRDARSVSRSSDVTDQTETGSNRGRALAAGVMPGARDSRAGVSNAGVWERSLSRSTRKRGGSAARQSRCRSCIYGWCRMHNDDERADGQFPCLQTCRRGAGAGKSCPGPFRRVGRLPMRSNEDPRERAVVWQRNDDAQAGCTRMCVEVAWPQPLWIRTDLFVVQARRIRKEIRRVMQRNQESVRCSCALSNCNR
ncbi:hypothetical protein RAS1_07960 [Phycisphaerae bacterium RAS1]|nr:hypothetical protein RAS1_07960 [Phycisphaerae bacterium RAS1]